MKHIMQDSAKDCMIQVLMQYLQNDNNRETDSTVTQELYQTHLGITIQDIHNKFIKSMKTATQYYNNANRASPIKKIILSIFSHLTNHELNKVFHISNSNITEARKMIQNFKKQNIENKNDENKKRDRICKATGQPYSVEYDKAKAIFDMPEYTELRGWVYIYNIYALISTYIRRVHTYIHT
jgi:hypothetical protein